MGTKPYLLVALAAYVATVTGSDLAARTAIAGETLAEAVAGHADWAAHSVFGILVLFAPYAGAAVLCARASKRARARAPLAIFCAALAVLGYHYYGGFQAAHHALLARRWTAAALAVGLLPFLVGAPVVAAVAAACAVAARVDRRRES